MKLFLLLLMGVAGIAVHAQPPLPAGVAESELAEPVQNYCAVLNQLRAQWQSCWDKVSNWFDEHLMDLVLALAGMVVAWLVAQLLRWIFTWLFLRVWKNFKTSVYYEQTVRAIRKPLTLMFFLAGVWVAVQVLLNTLPNGFALFLGRLFGTAVTLLAVWLIFRLLEVLNSYLLERSLGDSSMNLLLVNLLRKILKTVFLLLGLFFIGQNIFGLNVTALLAGAGVIGLAVALAAQDTLANFFGSVMILIDKPFTVGDRIKFGAIDGLIESVGFRSTKVRALDGNLFQVPNRQIADGVLENISRRPDIKYVFNIGLVYQTTPEQMQQAVQILHELLDRHPAFDAAKKPPLIYFTEFRDWSLNISVVVWFNTTDFLQSQQWKHEINLEILRRFNNAKLSFAYPTQTQFLTTDGAAPVEVKAKVVLKNKDNDAK